MKKLTGVIGAAFLLASCAPVALADFQISYKINSGSAIVCGTTPSASPTNGATCFASITNTPTSIGSGLGIANLSGAGVQTATDSQQFGSSLLIQNTGGATETLTIWLADQGFTSPTTPPSINYSSSLSITSFNASSGVTGTVGLESCVDTSNGLAPPTTAFCSTPAATLTNVPENYAGAGSASNTVTSTISSLTTTPYTLSQMITLTLSAGSDINIVTSQVLTPVPEPASLALLGSGLLGVGLLFRRKLGSKRS